MPVAFWDTSEAGYEELQDRNKNPWDILKLNGKRVPGIVTPGDIKVVPHLKMDMKKAVGSDGGPLIEVGHEPAKIDIAVTLWTPRQWELMQQIIHEIWRAPQKKPPRKEPVKDRRAAISIEHHCCAMLGIHAVLIEAVESLRPAPGNPGVMVLPIRAVQYIPPPKDDLSMVRKAAGAGPRTAIAPEFARARSGIPRRPPSQTDAVALPGPGPAQGTS